MTARFLNLLWPLLTSQLSFRKIEISPGKSIFLPPIPAEST